MFLCLIIALMSFPLISSTNNLSPVWTTNDKTLYTLGDEFLVNTQVQENQLSPSTTTYSNNEFAVVWANWADSGQDSSGHGINAQKFNINGTTIGEEFLVNQHTNDDQKYPNIAQSDTGDVMIVWESDSQDGSHTSVYAQIYDQEWAVKVNEFRVHTNSFDWQFWPVVTAISHSLFVIAYGEWTTSYTIHASMYYANGSSLRPDFQVSPYTTATLICPAIAALANDSFVIAWSSYEVTGYGIFASVYDHRGNNIVSTFQVDTAIAGYGVRIATLMNGGYLMAWSTTTNYDVYGVIFDRSSVPGLPFMINSYTTNSGSGDYIGQSRPYAASLSDDYFVVVWMSVGQDGDQDIGVFGRVFDLDANKLGTEFHVNTYTTSRQYFEAHATNNIAVFPDGRFVVVWKSWCQDYYESDNQHCDGVYAQRFYFESIETETTLAVTSTETSVETTAADTTAVDTTVVDTTVADTNVAETTIETSRTSTVITRLSNVTLVVTNTTLETTLDTSHTTAADTTIETRWTRTSAVTRFTNVTPIATNTATALKTTLATTGRRTRIIKNVVITKEQNDLTIVVAAVLATAACCCCAFFVSYYYFCYLGNKLFGAGIQHMKPEVQESNMIRLSGLSSQSTPFACDRNKSLSESRSQQIEGVIRMEEGVLQMLDQGATNEKRERVRSRAETNAAIGADLAPDEFIIEPDDDCVPDVTNSTAAAGE